MSEMDELIGEFLTESNENLDSLDRELVALEDDPDNRDRIAEIFRTIHTIKGTCGFLGFQKLERVTHVGENLLSKLRDGELAIDRAIASSLLTMVDAVRSMLGEIEQSGAEGDTDYSELIEVLDRLQHEGGGSDAELEAAEAVLAAVESPHEPEEPQAGEPAAQRDAGPRQAEQRDVEEELAAAPAIQKGSKHESSIRVDVDLLDRLMNLVGELVLTRNQILQHGDLGDAALAATTQRLNHITSELQESVMKTRMQTIGNVWNKFPRVVRDLAVACGKQVRIEMDGRETELDKTLIEAIKDPLTHIVRNSVDHGIESPEARVAAGKPAEGTLHLRAYHEGGRVNIEVTDDGGGINPERVKAKAVANGMITADQAEQMTDRDAVNLVFLPGFSMAERVTNVSGRGVGMDVVSTNIKKIGGSIDVQSNLGEGTAIRIKIPLTLAIIPALMVTCGAERFAIPQASLLELVRLDHEELKTGIEHVYNVPVYRLRGNLLTLVDLRKVLAMEPRDENHRSAVNIVVLQIDGRSFGLIVDAVNDSEEIVVKPLGSQLKSNPVFAGATILGDGHVALILDVIGVAMRSGVFSKIDQGGGREEDGPHLGRSSKTQTLLIFDAGRHSRLGLCLDKVARLEEIPRASVELAGDQEVVRYRGEIMPLLQITRCLGGLDGEERPDLHVVVHQYRGRNVGLVVDRIIDITDVELVLDTSRARPGVIGAAVIHDRVTEIVDVEPLLDAMHLFAVDHQEA